MVSNGKEDVVSDAFIPAVLPQKYEVTRSQAWKNYRDA